jgi:hypothetical protein
MWAEPLVACDKRKQYGSKQNDYSNRQSQTPPTAHLTKSGWMIFAISSVELAPRTPAE